MAFVKKREDRYGYAITAHDNHGWNRRIERWFEGDALIDIEKEVMEEIIKKILEYFARKIVGRYAGGVASVAYELSSAIGEPIGNFISMSYRELLHEHALMQLVVLSFDNNSGIDIEITGDFALKYKLEAESDLKQDLIEVLACLPAVFSTEKEPLFMKQNVVESVYLLQLHYCAQQVPKLSSEQQQNIKLTIDIDI